MYGEAHPPHEVLLGGRAGEGLVLQQQASPLDSLQHLAPRSHHLPQATSLSS